MDIANQTKAAFTVIFSKNNLTLTMRDVRALRKILFNSSLGLFRKYIVENSIVTSVPHAVENMLHLDWRHELLVTFSDKLFNATDTGPIKRSMAQNIAESGLSYDDLHKLYTTFGERALVAILSNPPTTSSARTPRVTRTKRILASIVEQRPCFLFLSYSFKVTSCQKAEDWYQPP